MMNAARKNAIKLSFLLCASRLLAADSAATVPASASERNPSIAANAAVAQALAAAEKIERDQVARLRRDPQWQPAYAEVAVLDVNRLYTEGGAVAQEKGRGKRVWLRSFCVASDGRLLR
jgi:hypothetical protein